MTLPPSTRSRAHSTSLQGDPEHWALDIPPASSGPDRRDRVRLSYGELERRAALLQKHLANLLEPPDAEPIVVLLFERTDPDLYSSWLAVLRAGAAVACVDPTFPDGFLEEVLSDAKAPLLLTCTAGAERARTIDCVSARVLDVSMIDLDAVAVKLPDPAAVPPDRLAYVIYTSGTTGRPKGVMIERASLDNLIAADLEEFGIGPGDRVAQVSSPAYDSWVEETWLAFAAGATLVVIDKETQRLGPDLVPWLRAERVTALCPPPTLLRMAASGSGDSIDLPELRLLYVGGEALTEDVVRAWAPGRRLVNGYGPTECTVTILRADIGLGEEITLGQPVRGNDARLESESGEWLIGPGTGELYLSGLSLARGYLGRESLTREKFPEREGIRFYRTGDLVERTAEGELLFRGRIDAQVKLHGQRIELEAIEARLADASRVRDVACAVQRVGGREQLTAHVVPNTWLEPSAFEELAKELQNKLRNELPSYMVPRVFAPLRELPRSVSGKVQRESLPLPTVRTGASTNRTTSAMSSAEESIAQVFAFVLGREPESVHPGDDFFVDLGGESLTAVRALVALRELHQDCDLTTRDLYEARTVEALAARMVSALTEGAASPAAPPQEQERRRSVGWVTALQTLVIGTELVVGSVVMYFAVVHVLPWLLVKLGLAPLLLLAPLGFTLGHWVLSIGATLILAAVLKIFVGRTQPGRIPAWSPAYFKAWLLSHWSAALPWGTVQGTALHAVLLRLLGAKIGARVHLHRGVSFRRGGWDLLEIGDDVTIAQDAAVLVSELEDGCLVQGPVVIGSRSTLDVRSTVGPHCRLGEGVFLRALGWVAPHSRLGANSTFDGLPAREVGPAPTPHHSAQKALSPAAYTAAHLGLQLATSFLAWLPAALLLLLLARVTGTTAAAIASWFEAPTYDPVVLGAIVLVTLLAAPISLVVSAILMRAVGEVRTGTRPRLSYGYLRIWWKSAQLERAGRWLSGSLFWPPWLRLAGMKIGRQCEISSIIDVLPERVSIGPSSFFADGIYLGGPRIHCGTVTVEDTTLGRETFLGNHVVVPNGASIADGAFYGVCTVAHVNDPTGEAWFGHPLFQLPRREVLRADRSVTHEPGPLRYANRLFWESARFVLPLLPLLAAVSWFAFLASLTAAGGALLAPAATLLAAAFLFLATLGLKWALLGRVRPGQHALWSCWCSRWDFVYVAWQFWARGVLSGLEGTLLLAPFLRAMGMEIGRRVLLGDGFAHVVDPDMLHLEDDSTVNGLFQAHSFEDRILKLGKVRIGRGASVAHGALLFYDVELADGAVLAPHAVAMKGERLRRAMYQGSPCGATPSSRSALIP